MFSTALIVFREALEAALVIGLVLAASRGLPRRGLWVAGGIAAGTASAVLVAVFAGAIGEAVAGVGQELFNAAVLFAAVAMLGWHNVWMGRHGVGLAREINAVGRDVAAGTRPLYVLAAIVGLAVLREGAEVVLFLYGIALAQQHETGAMLIGGLVGLGFGAALGLLLYLGLLRLAARHLFTVTGWLITLLAAGMSAQAAGYLVQADLLPPLVDTVWDTSAILPQNSLVGHVLQVLIGYIDRPSGIQVLFYVLTLGTILMLSRIFRTVPQAPARPGKRSAQVSN